jgi:hypothetical protein
LIGEAANGEIKEVSAEMIKQYALMISPIDTGSAYEFPQNRSLLLDYNHIE